MATTTMHFGPEWMRAKPQTPARQQPPPSPPPPAASTAQQLGASTYSALVTPATQELEKRDESRPFRYTKEEMLRIYKEGGGRSGLNLEVERWEGIVRDVGNEPAGLREMNEAERKLFAGPLNSELRRRQSTDPINTLASPSDRQRSNHPSSATGSPMRFGPFLGRRRDSTDQPPLVLPRKLSLSNTQSTTLASPRDALPSPRNRMGAFGSGSGFDGVLNSGDTWTRRRPSTGGAGAGGGPTARAEGKEEDARPSEIKEEEEGAGRDPANAQDSHPNAVKDQSQFSSVPNAPPLDVIPDSQPPLSGPDSVAQSMAGMTMGEQNGPDPNSQNPPTMNPIPSGPPPGLADPASIEWSYLDPQGQVQGPFRADLMQKWFDEGYFTPDLLMKRTHIDTEWLAVRVLERHVGGGRIFLSQLPIPKGPPSLLIHTDSPQSYSPVHEQGAFNGYQPVPTRTLRTTTLDSYLNGPSPSESPSSSLSGGRFGNGSPDPSSFGGRPGNNAYPGDPNLAGRAFGGRSTFQEPILDPRALNNIAIGRAPTIDTFNSYSGGGSPWSAGPGQMGQPFSNHEQHHYSNGFSGIGSGMLSAAVPINQAHGINHERFGDATYNGMGSLTSHHDSPVARQPSDANGIPFNNTTVNGINGSQFGASSQFPQSPAVPFVAPQHGPSISTFVDTLPQASEPLSTPASAVQPNSPSPWTTRPKPFDPPAAPSPSVPPARPHMSEWTTPQPVQPADPSPWLMASVSAVDDVWKEIPGPNSLTFSNLGQHNRLHQQEEEEGSSLVASPIDDSPSLPPPVQLLETDPSNTASAAITTTSVQLATPAISTSPAAVPKARRKSTARDLQVTVPKVVAPPASVPTIVKDPLPTPIPSAVPPKPAWAVEEDSKKMSLREIQEAEVKQTEARKSAERERERLARANAAVAPSIVEESQPFIASWGLPTSQAGARNLAPPKEASPTSTTPSNTPVWTTTSSLPTAKKTMKEIQEEEERKKKLAVKESVASAASRRAYAETTVKVGPSAPAPGGAWTMVGANGKSNPPATTVARPAATSVAPTNPPPQVVVPRPNGTAARPAATTAAKVVAPRAEDFPVTPSHDFLKWLGESLKGLNSSVNLEEITSMLLSFPLNPDQSTVEIISDLIYANSTTLDGRRFASEYVSKRKADAASRRGTAGASSSNGKPVSIADVVKTQPKPVQQEWGFKVVNKKKKGGRS